MDTNFDAIKNKIYDDGLAIVQYSIGRNPDDFEGFLARHRDCLYEIHDKIEFFDAEGINLKTASLKAILSLPNTKKIRG